MQSRAVLRDLGRKEPVRVGASRANAGARGRAGLGCRQAGKGRMLEAVRQQSRSTGVHVHPLCPAESVCPAGPQLPPCSVVEGFMKIQGHSSGNNSHTCLFPSSMENPIFQRTSDSLLVGKCREICFYWMCFCSLETKTQSSSLSM